MKILNLTGQQFGQSELRELIAIGESGAVYRGFHSGLDRTVAVKVLLPLIARNTELFTREMQAADQLKHTNILPVYEYGVEENLAYITMPPVTGGTLDARRVQALENKRSLPSLREIAIFFRQSAAALDHAHRHNVLHLDIKPSNIIFDAEGVPHLTDFGIGRLKYASSEEPSPAVDQYALAATVATLLANPLPFDVTDPACTIGDHLDEFTAVLQTQYPQAADVMLPIFQQAFATDPAERFPTAADCSKAFDALRAFPADTTKFFTVYTMRDPIPSDIQALAAPKEIDVQEPVLEPAVVVSDTPDGLVPVDSRPIHKSPIFWVMIVMALAVAGGMLLTLPDRNENESPSGAPIARVTAVPDAAVAGLVSSGVQENSAWVPVEQEINNLPMVQVPAGCFMMGKERSAKEFEVPVHQVCVSSFWIGQTEVTNAQYRQCVDAGACEPPSDRTYFDDPEFDDYPAVFVNWTQANAFAQWAGGILPTDAQWEYAARGPENWLYSWGNEREGTRLNFCDNSCENETKDHTFDDGYAQLAPVGSFPDGASWVGAFDMTGNVWEWVSDWYGLYTDTAQIDPTGPANGEKRILRGGSWTNNLDAVRATYRTAAGPGLTQPHAGFRIAMPAEAGSTGE